LVNSLSRIELGQYVGIERHNGLRFSRREASAASEAVGWKRVLGGISSQGVFAF
jgi:hypothetical protein